MKSLTKSELDSLLKVARGHSEVDYLMLLVTFNHGLRSSETLALTARNLVDGYLVVNRLKKSKRTIQPLLPTEKDGLQMLAETQPAFLFPLNRMAFWRKMQKYGEEAGIPQFKRHAHVLKHTCGRLGYEGGMGIPELQKYLGHVNGGNTMVYLEADEEKAAAAFAMALGA